MSGLKDNYEMIKFECKNCKKTKELQKATLVIIEGKVKTKEAKCKCGQYMESKPNEGMPGLIRTEPTLTKK